MTFALETERLILRSWRAGDVDSFARHLNTPAVARTVGGVQTRDEIEAAIVRIRRCEADNGFCFWALERRSDGAFLGFCGLKRLNAEGLPAAISGRPEIGWRLREDAWRQGYAREAAQATLAAAFGGFRLDEVFAITLADNAPSRGLMRRIGMTPRSEFDFEMPVHGRHVVYRIGGSEWSG